LFERFFSRFSSKKTLLRDAERAEHSGDLGKAAALFAEAAAPHEAARVMILRGDGEADPAKRLVHYTQAAATAPSDHETALLARKKRALLVIALAGDGAISAATRADVADAARELEEIGENESAATAYARIGDVEGEARALARAGDVEKLEVVLEEQGERDRAERARTAAHREIEMMFASGRRREAIAAAEAFAAKTEGAAREALTTRAQQMRARRAKGPLVRLAIEGRAVSLVLGAEVVVGRHEGALQVASAAVSRRHVAIARDGEAIVVRDLGSANGTLLRGMRIAGAVPIGDGVELRLGKEVPMRVAPSDEMQGAVAIDLAGERYVAPLGSARVGVGEWRLEMAADGWIELVSDGGPAAIVDGAALVTRASLLVGDAIARARGGEPVLRVLGDR
jgi:hypothetical protein